jgi:inner membrane transporter RhtA
LSIGKVSVRGPSPTVLTLLAIASVQLGSAIAKHLFSQLGPGGTTFLRVGFGAIVLLLVWRPSLRGHRPSQYAMAALFGLTVAAMNLSFYFALDRIPLGIAVTVEFLGPLGLAVAGSRRALDLLWVGLAGGGVVLLSPGAGGAHLDAMGIVFALMAGVFWASYILLSARVGQIFTGGRGLAIALAVGGIALLPLGIVSAGGHLADPRLLLGGLVVALLSAVIPYSLELEALRSLPARVFGVLMSMEPAAGALFGFLILRQVLEPRAIVALALVSVASLGASQTGAPLVVD